MFAASSAARHVLAFDRRPNRRGALARLALRRSTARACLLSEDQERESRGVPLHRDLVAELANLPHRDGAVFRQARWHALWAAVAARATPRRAAVKTAFQGACGEPGSTNFRVHDCRHTWATWHFAEHRDLIALQHLGGWKTLSMVTRYAHASSTIDREASTPCRRLVQTPCNRKTDDREAS